MPTVAELLATLTAAPGRADRVTHVELVPARPARPVDWPDWVDPQVKARLGAAGIRAPWSHQVAAASLAWAGQSVVVATGTASGKSLVYLLPALTAARRGGAHTLYLSPTKALAADQLRGLDALAVPGVVAAGYDGDTPIEARDMARAHASYLLTNPDMLDHSVLLWGSGMSDSNSHSSIDVPYLMVGNGAGLFNGNRHLVAPRGTPLSNTMLSVAQKFGAEIDKFGVSTGTFDLNA